LVRFFITPKEFYGLRDTGTQGRFGIGGGRGGNQERVAVFIGVVRDDHRFASSRYAGYRAVFKKRFV
jgi:hypothetical protein